MLADRLRAAAGIQAEEDPHHAGRTLERREMAGLEVDLDHVLGGEIPVGLRLVTEYREVQRLPTRTRAQQGDHVRGPLGRGQARARLTPVTAARVTICVSARPSATQQ